MYSQAPALIGSWLIHAVQDPPQPPTKCPTPTSDGDPGCPQNENG